MSKNNEIIDEIIKTTDEEGNIHNFKLVEILEIDNYEYGIFEYIDVEGTNKDIDEEELIIMRIIHKDNNYFFEEIEDDDEFNRVIDYIDENEDELDFE